jgi:hypothetical protein
MANDFRSKFDPLRRVNENPAAGDEPAEADHAPAEEEPPEAAGRAFSMVSADRRQKLMLELRFKSGNSTALAYSYLVSADLDPSKSIVMDFSGYAVTLAGRNLRPLFAGLIAQRVAVVCETDDLQAEAMLPSDATVVTSIGVTPRE